MTRRCAVVFLLGLCGSQLAQNAHSAQTAQTAMDQAAQTVQNAVSAEGPRDREEEIIVTGARTASTPERVPYAVTSLDRSELDSRNAVDLVSALAELPGVQVQSGTAASGFATVLLRGSEANFVTVVVDGVRVNDPNNSRGGGFDFSAISPDDVERIEVARGAYSAVYGSDALGGVIQVITRSRAAPGWNGSYQLGDAGLDSAQLGGALPLGALGQLSLNGEHFDQGNTVAGASARRDAGRMRLVLADAERWRVQVQGQRVETRAAGFPETSGGPEFAAQDGKDERDGRETTAAVQGELQLTASWRAAADVSRFERDEEFVSPGILPGVLDGVPSRTSSTNLQRTVAVLQSAWTLAPGWRTTLGFDHQIERATTAGTIQFGEAPIATQFALERISNSGFLEVQSSVWDRLTLLAGVRYDALESAAGVWTGRAGAVVEAVPGRTFLRVNWGEGFKWPSFFAIGDPLTGNPKLRPEQSSGVDAGITQLWRDGKLQLDAFVFATTYRDLVDFDFESFRSVNRNSVRIRGAEAGGSWRATPAVRVRGHVTYLDADVADGEPPLRQRPRWRGGLSTTWALGQTELRLAWLAVGAVNDTSIATGARVLDSYQRFDLNLSWQVTTAVTLQLAVDNLLDERYSEAIGFTAAGISPRLKFKIAH